MSKPLSKMTKCEKAQRAFMDCRELLRKEQERSALFELERDQARRGLQEVAAGGEPSWLFKDFNVLYRAAQRVMDTLATTVGHDRADAVLELKVQLDRLAPAFTVTEEVRRLMRERQG